MKRTLAVCVLLVLAIPAAAQLQPTMEKGFQSGKAYSFGDLDGVSVFNGNLNVSVPLGHAYPAGGDLQYSFQLNYSGNNWSYVYRVYEYWWDPFPSIPGDEEEEWRFDDQNWSEPFKRSNAGLGWLFSFGRIYSPEDDQPIRAYEYDPDQDEWEHPVDPSRLIYQGPDGSEHELYIGLHGGPPLANANTPVRYSRDSTYIRYTRLADANDDPTGHLLEFADGTIREFNADGSIREIRDRHGNKITVESFAQLPVGAPAPDTSSGACSTSYNVWRISDNFGRKHYAYFLQRPIISKTEPVPERLCELNLAAFEGNRAVYKFGYTNRVISRQSIPSERNAPDAIGPVVTAPMLTTITLPDQTTYTAVYDIGSRNGVGFRSDTSSSNVPNELSSLGGPNPGGFSGHLIELTVPTGGKYSWTYESYLFPPSRYRHEPGENPDHAEYQEDKPYRNQSAGIKTRTKTNPGAPAATWTYDSLRLSSAGFKPVGMVTTVTAPDGTKTKSYFTACSECPVGYEHADFGLPYLTRPSTSTSDHGPNPVDGRFLSSRQYASDGTTILRTTYVRYEREVGGDINKPNFNPRLLSSQTVFDNGATTTVTNSDFDGYGHYRNTETRASDSTLVRKTRTNYNPTLPPYNEATFTPISSSAPWIISTFDTTEVRDQVSGSPDVVAAATHCFDTTTGFLRWKRSVRGGGKPDLLAVFKDADLSGNNIDGNVSVEEYYGGDDFGIPAFFDGTCTSNYANLVTPEYRLLHTYDKGMRKTSKYDGMNFFTLDLDIDSSGLPSASRDTSGYAASFKYDSFGRLRKVTPSFRAWTSYEYVNATAGAGPAVHVKRCLMGSPESCPTPSEASTFRYDGFGRLVEERRRVKSAPDTEEWATSWTTYDAFDRRKSVSVTIGRPAATQPEAMPAGTKITLWNYDSLGRILDITQPDNAVTSFTYPNPRVTTRTSNVATAEGSQESVTTEETYDFLGRLIQVTEDAGVGRANLKTGYRYDVGDRLTNVRGPATVLPANADRTFVYDGAGLLASETHPESGTATYLYDSRGHVIRKNTADCWFDLKFDLDSAERVTTVWGRSSTTSPCSETWQPMKEFTFDATPGFRLGRLKTSVRYNATPAGEVKVTENFAYDPDGLIVQKDTIVDNVTTSTRVQKFIQSFAYGQLGTLLENEYPVCDHVGCGEPWGDGVQNIYANGALKQMKTLDFPSEIASFAYHPNGLRTTIAHSNGIVDTITPDPNGIPRPHKIEYSSVESVCNAPQITAQTGSHDVLYGATTTLSVSVSGTAPLAYTWYSESEPDGIPDANGPTYTPPPMTGRETYWVIIESSCGKDTSIPIVVTARTAAPTDLVAWKVAASTVTVSWTATTGADSYSVERRINGGSFTEIGTASAAAYSDTTCPSGKTCVYRVRGVTGDGDASDPSNQDIATMLSFTALTAGQTPVLATHLEEIRTAINAIRVAAGSSVLSWSSILPSGLPAPAYDVPVGPAYITSLRTRMNEALQLHGVPVSSYTDPSPTVIRVLHFEQLRERSQ